MVKVENYFIVQGPAGAPKGMAYCGLTNLHQTTLVPSE
jgi:hypothetical protein